MRNSPSTNCSGGFDGALGSYEDDGYWKMLVWCMQSRFQSLITGLGPRGDDFEESWSAQAGKCHDVNGARDSGVDPRDTRWIDVSIWGYQNEGKSGLSREEARTEQNRSPVPIEDVIRSWSRHISPANHHANKYEHHAKCFIAGALSARKF